MSSLRPLPIDLDELSIAFEANSQAGGPDSAWYVDTDTGAVILLNREYEPSEFGGLTATDIETDPVRFRKVPPVDPMHAIADMNSFTAHVIDVTLKESLELALSAPRPFKSFKAALSWLPDQLARWHAWKMERCRRRVTAWLADQGFEPTSRAA
ncbi:MAG: UPF0158 family protein [Myxococcaceae bacterium]